MRFVVALFLLFGCFDLAHAADIRLRWEFDVSPTATCVDGTPAAQDCPLTSFEIQQSDNADSTSWVVLPPSVEPELREKLLTGFTPGTHCFRMRAESNGSFSEPSTIACTTIPFSPPRSPNNITVVTVTVTISQPQ